MTQSVKQYSKIINEVFKINLGEQARIYLKYDPETCRRVMFSETMANYLILLTIHAVLKEYSQKASKGIFAMKIAKLHHQSDVNQIINQIYSLAPKKHEPLTEQDIENIDNCLVETINLIRKTVGKENFNPQGDFANFCRALIEIVERECGKDFLKFEPAFFEKLKISRSSTFSPPSAPHKP